MPNSSMRASARNIYLRLLICQFVLFLEHVKMLLHRLHPGKSLLLREMATLGDNEYDSTRFNNAQF